MNLLLKGRSSLMKADADKAEVLSPLSSSDDP